MNEVIERLRVKAQALGGTGFVHIEGDNETSLWTVKVDDSVTTGYDMDSTLERAEANIDEEARAKIVRLQQAIKDIKAVWTT